MRKRRAVKSSLELFLDTVCNVFGGLVFIMILVAIQIRHTVGIIKPPEETSPERIAEMRQELDQILADIAASNVLLEALRSAMPRPKDPAEQELVDQFFQLSSAKGASAVKKAELLNQQLANEKERIDWEEKAKSVETTLQQAKNEQQRLEHEVERQQKEQETLNTSSKKLQNEIDELNQQIAQKEQNLNNASQQRDETIYLPKLRDAGNKRGIYFVLRFNRFYAVSNRGDFDYTGNSLGIPKRNRGIPVEDIEETKRQIRSLFPGSASDRMFLSVFVYGDSADQWYVIRDLIVTAGFEYELIPTADDTPWVFGGSGGSSSVQ